MENCINMTREQIELKRPKMLWNFKEKSVRLFSNT